LLAQLLRDFGKFQQGPKANIQVRMLQQKGLYSHLPANCYIFLGKGLAKAIIGSSSLAWEDLCSAPQLNYLETDPLKVTTLQNNYTPFQSHLSWFQEWWDKCDDWTRNFFNRFSSINVKSASKANHLPLITPVSAGNMSQRSRQSSNSFKVTFPNGTVINKKYASQTFIETLRTIGLSQVQALGIDAVRGYNVVSNMARPPQGNNKWQDFVGNKYIYTKLGNDRKKELLRQIATKLGIQIIIQ